MGSLVLTPLGKTYDFKHELGFLVTLVFLNLSSALALTSHPFFWGFEAPNTESSHPNQWFPSPFASLANSCGILRRQLG